MPHPDSEKWNALYNAESHLSAPRSPHSLLASHLDLLPEPGLALDIACGTTSTGLFLAAHQWQVIGLDVAASAVRIAQARARGTAIPISFVVMDLTDPWLPDSHFDVILNFYYLSRPLLQLYKKILKPGGVLFMETFVWQPGIELNPNHYLQPDELRNAFHGWEIIFSETNIRQHSNDKSRKIDQIIVRRPSEHTNLPIRCPNG